MPKCSSRCCTLLVSFLVLTVLSTAVGQENGFKHELPEGVELVDPKSLGLSDADLSKFLGNVKVLGGGQIGDTKTQILSVGFDGDENINFNDFHIPGLTDSNATTLPQKDKEIADVAFKRFKEFFQDPKKARQFEDNKNDNNIPFAPVKGPEHVKGRPHFSQNGIQENQQVHFQQNTRFPIPMIHKPYTTPNTEARPFQHQPVANQPPPPPPQVQHVHHPQQPQRQYVTPFTQAQQQFHSQIKSQSSNLEFGARIPVSPTRFPVVQQEQPAQQQQFQQHQQSQGQFQFHRQHQQQQHHRLTIQHNHQQQQTHNFQQPPPVNHQPQPVANHSPPVHHQPQAAVSHSPPAHHQSQQIIHHSPPQQNFQQHAPPQLRPPPPPPPPRPQAQQSNQNFIINQRPPPPPPPSQNNHRTPPPVLPQHQRPQQNQQQQQPREPGRIVRNQLLLLNNNHAENSNPHAKMQPPPPPSYESATNHIINHTPPQNNAQNNPHASATSHVYIQHGPNPNTIHQTPFHPGFQPPTRFAKDFTPLPPQATTARPYFEVTPSMPLIPLSTNENAITDPARTLQLRQYQRDRPQQVSTAQQSHVLPHAITTSLPTTTPISITTSYPEVEDAQTHHPTHNNHDHHSGSQQSQSHQGPRPNNNAIVDNDVYSKSQFALQTQQQQHQLHLLQRPQQQPQQFQPQNQHNFQQHQQYNRPGQTQPSQTQQPTVFYTQDHNSKPPRQGQPPPRFQFHVQGDLGRPPRFHMHPDPKGLLNTIRRKRGYRRLSNLFRMLRRERWDRH